MDNISIIGIFIALLAMIAAIGQWWANAKQTKLQVEKSEREAIDKIGELRARVEKLEQKVDMKDEFQRKELADIKAMLMDLTKRLNEHMDMHQ